MDNKTAAWSELENQDPAAQMAERIWNLFVGRHGTREEVLAIIREECPTDELRATIESLNSAYSGALDKRNAVQKENERLLKREALYREYVELLERTGGNLQAFASNHGLDARPEDVRQGERIRTALAESEKRDEEGHRTRKGG